MKKAVRDRSIFTIIACIALAASMLLTTVRVTPVHMADDVSALVGAEAEESFNAFFEGVQSWYQEIPAGEDGVVISQQGNFASLMSVVATLGPFIAACEEKAVETEENEARLLEYNGPLTSLLVVMLNLANIVRAEGSYTFAAEEWARLGEVITNTVAAYQN